MPHGPTYIFVQCKCPSCGKMYHAEVYRDDPPEKSGKCYMMKCWQCHGAGKPQWVKDWINKAKNWGPE